MDLEPFTCLAALTAMFFTVLVAPSPIPALQQQREN
jgi:hypothetical protein